MKRRIYDISEGVSDFDNPSMEEAFRYVIDNKILADFNIDPKKSYKVVFPDWSAGVIFTKNQKDRVFVYSFDDKCILCKCDDVTIERSPITADPECLCVRRWKGSNTLRNITNKDGLIFKNDDEWFTSLSRLGGKERYYVGTDTTKRCKIFDMDGNIMQNVLFSNYQIYTGGVFFQGSFGGVMYDNDLNVVLDGVTKVSNLHYFYCDADFVWKSHDCYLISAQKGDSFFIFDSDFNLIISDIDNISKFDIKAMQGGRINCQVYGIEKNGRYNVFGQDCKLVFGDPGDENTWLDSFSRTLPKKGSIFFVAEKGGKKTLFHGWRLDVIVDEWFDEIIPITVDSQVIAGKVAAVKNNGKCNLVGIDIKDKDSYGKVLIKKDVDDIKTTKKFIFASIDDKVYLVWKNGSLIQTGSVPINLQPLIYVIEVERDKLDIISESKELTFCDIFMDGNKLDGFSLIDSDVRGIIEYEDKFSYMDPIPEFRPVFTNEDGSIKWFDSVEPAVFDTSSRKVKCSVIENGKNTVYYV